MVTKHFHFDLKDEVAIPVVQNSTKTSRKIIISIYTLDFSERLLSVSQNYCFLQSGECLSQYDHVYYSSFIIIIIIIFHHFYITLQWHYCQSILLSFFPQSVIFYIFLFINDMLLLLFCFFYHCNSLLLSFIYFLIFF